MKKIFFIFIVLLVGCATVTKNNVSKYDDDYLCRMGTFMGRDRADSEMKIILNETIKRGLVREKYKNEIINDKIRVGMNKCEVELSWGQISTNKIRNITSQYGTREQWIYGSTYDAYSDRTYVYFSNGEVTTIQE